MNAGAFADPVDGAVFVFDAPEAEVRDFVQLDPCKRYEPRLLIQNLLHYLIVGFLKKRVFPSILGHNWDTVL